MEIRQLRCFIAVADTLNFSRAASSVYLSQSALSRQIMDLEKEIGLPLFVRSTRRVELTEAGKALQVSAKELISRWEKMIPEVRNAADAEQQALALTIGVDARALAAPERRRRFTDILYRLRRAYPGLRVLLRNGDYAELVRGINNGTLDCMLILDRPQEQRPELMQQCFGGEEMVLVFRSENRHQDSDYGDIIRNRGLILVDREPHGLYHIIRILTELQLEPQIRFCESLDDMAMTVETGESAAILPQSVVYKLDDPRLTILHLPCSQVQLELLLLWNCDQTNPMLDILIQRMQESGFA